MINVEFFDEIQNDKRLPDNPAKDSVQKQNEQALLDDNIEYDQLDLDLLNKEMRSERGLSQVLDKYEKSQKAEGSDSQEEEHKDDVYNLPDEFVMDMDGMDFGDPDLLKLQSIEFTDLKRRRSKSFENLRNLL